jgi:VWFA-related protein
MPPPPPAKDEFKVSSEVDIVLLDVAVKDKKGGFVSGLAKDGFEVFENKVKQDLSIFAAQDVPVTVGLVVDNSGSVRPKKPEVVVAALTFVGKSHPKDEIFVVNFNDRVKMGLPDGVDFSDDHQLLRAAMLTNPAEGRTALYDAIKRGLNHLEKGRLDKKTLVVISDGGDNSSDTTRDQIMDLAERSLATIYTVGIFNPADKDKNPGVLKDLAKLTGGEFYEPENISHLVGVCEKIATDIRNRYTLGYSPKNTQFDGKPRKLRIVAKGEDGRQLEARTRTHYVAIPLEERARKTK